MDLGREENNYLPRKLQTRLSHSVCTLIIMVEHGMINLLFGLQLQLHMKPQTRYVLSFFFSISSPYTKLHLSHYLRKRSHAFPSALAKIQRHEEEHGYRVKFKNTTVVTCTQNTITLYNSKKRARHCVFIFVTWFDQSINKHRYQCGNWSKVLVKGR